jgi:hypothetical protein
MNAPNNNVQKFRDTSLDNGSMHVRPQNKPISFPESKPVAVIESSIDSVCKFFKFFKL